MYFFGYGNFISANAALGLVLGHNFSVRGGYILGNRTEIHGTSERLGISLIQQGPVVGVEAKW